jgi:hypothetical protein
MGRSKADIMVVERSYIGQDMDDWPTKNKSQTKNKPNPIQETPKTFYFWLGYNGRGERTLRT